MSLEPGMTPSFGRARARGSQPGMTTLVPWGKRSRSALVKGDRCAPKSRRISSCAGRGTGMDHGEGEFFTLGGGILERNSSRYPPWVSAFACCFGMFLPFVGRGSRQRARWDFFGVRSSIWFHFVPSTSTYLERAKYVSGAGARDVGGEILNGRNWSARTACGRTPPADPPARLLS
jgi:hypothetical protein